MKNRLRSKKRQLPSKKVKDIDLERQVEKAIQKANERIKSVSKKYKGTTYMWAVNKLHNKVGNKFFRNNRIVLPKKVKTTELIKIYKEIESFMKSKESTKTGIKEVQQKAKKTIKNELFDVEISEDDVDVYYSMLEDKDFNTLLNKDFTASEFWVTIDDSINDGDTEEDFYERLSQYPSIKDENLRNKAKNLYNKYVK